MSLHIISNDKTINNLVSIFTNSGSPSRSFTINRSSGENNLQDIGSKVIDNNDTNKAKEENEFAYTNQRPVLNQPNYGDISITNYSRVIRSSLVSTAIRNGDYNYYSGEFTTPIQNNIIYLCSPHQDGLSYSLGKNLKTESSPRECFQFYPPSPDEIMIPTSFNATTSELEQNGLWLRYRSKDDTISDWSVIYVPSGLITPYVYTDPTSGLSYNLITIDYNSILPNGEYIVEFDSYYGA